MYKHIIYSFKGKKSLYILFMLTIVIATVVSIYSLNTTSTFFRESNYDRISFPNEQPYDYIGVHNLIESGEINSVEETFDYVPCSFAGRGGPVTVYRESSNKWFGKEFKPNSVIFSSGLVGYFKPIEVGDIIRLGDKDFEVLAISKTIFGGDVIIPYNIESNVENVSFNDLNAKNGYVAVNFTGKISNQLKETLKSKGLINRGFSISFYDFYGFYTYILPQLITMGVCLACIILLYGYIVKKDKDIITVFKATGANHSYFVITMLLEFIVIFSLFFGIGCGIILPILVNGWVGITTYLTGLDIFIFWLAFVSILTVGIGLSQRNVFRLEYKHRKTDIKGCR